MDVTIINEIAGQQNATATVIDHGTGVIELKFTAINGPFLDADKGPRTIPFAKHVVREIVKHNGGTLPFGIVGGRSKNEDGTAGDDVDFLFGTGVENGLPNGWLPKKFRPGKPAEIVELEAILPELGARHGDGSPLDIQYFNSSTNEGVVVHDPRIPVGLQFVVDDNGLHAKFLKFSAIGGKKTWTVRELVDVSHAVQIINALIVL